MREEEIRKAYSDQIKYPILKPFYWLKSYWYYYKIPILAVIGAAILVIGIASSILGKEKLDYTVSVVSRLSVDQEDYETVCRNFEAVLADIDGNGEVHVGINCIQIDIGMTDEYSAAAYDALTAMRLYDQVAFFLVDDYCAQYLEDLQAIEPLSVLGITGGEDEYRIKVTGTALLQDTSVDEYIDYYLVVKKLGDADRDNEKYLARREAIAPMIAEVLQ